MKRRAGLVSSVARYSGLKKCQMSLALTGVLGLVWASPASTGYAMTEPAATSTRLASSAVPRDASPTQLYPLASGSTPWTAWGSGEMRFWGFRLYHATLWVAGTELKDSPYALVLHYRRDISRQQLVDASLDEMRRLDADESSLKQWQADLARVFPDVKEGDRIVGLFIPGQGARFFHQGRLTGEVNDVNFAERFFAIWLDPRTRSPDVRAQLLQRPVLTVRTR